MPTQKPTNREVHGSSLTDLWRRKVHHAIPVMLADDEVRWFARGDITVRCMRPHWGQAFLVVTPQESLRDSCFGAEYAIVSSIGLLLGVLPVPDFIVGDSWGPHATHYRYAIQERNMAKRKPRFLRYSLRSLLIAPLFLAGYLACGPATRKNGTQDVERFLESKYGMEGPGEKTVNNFLWRPPSTLYLAPLIVQTSGPEVHSPGEVAPIDYYFWCFGFVFELPF